MKWPWSERVEAAVAKAAEADREAKRIESQWDFITDQLDKLRTHRDENHFTQIIQSVARGAK